MRPDGSLADQAGYDPDTRLYLDMPDGVLEVMSVSPNDEETNKRLDAMLLARQPVLVLDNIDAPLGGDRLCSILSELDVSLRLLGVSEVASIPVTRTVLATGNNMRLKGDVTRRAFVARLDAGTERPELHRFDSHPVEDAMAQRWDYVRAALTIILAYHPAGCLPARQFRGLVPDGPRPADLGRL